MMLCRCVVVIAVLASALTFPLTPPVDAQSRRQKRELTAPEAPPKAPSSVQDLSSGKPHEPPASADDGDVISVTSNLVPLLASVVNAQGEAVPHLTLADFELLVDGSPRPIGELSRSEMPVRLALLFDNSSSLNVAREFEKRAAVRFFRRVIRPIDQASIISISSTPEMVQTLTSDVKRLVDVIEGFGKPKGATAMLDAVAQAAEYLLPQQGRKVIIIVSDGADTVSERSFEATMRLVQAANCQVYAVQTGQSANANLHDLTAERRLRDLTSQTGGAMFVPQTTSDLDATFTQISADLAQQYVLSYYPMEEKRDGRFHAVALRVPTQPATRVRTRKGYYAPKG
ncbi:MAG: VWA domain-containing protein [Pyrinomonadaceae bacterium]